MNTRSGRKAALVGALAAAAVVGTVAVAGNITLPHTFTSGTTARAAEVNANFSAVKTASDDNQAQITALKAAFDDAAYCPRLVNKDGTLRVYAKDLSTAGVVRCTAGTDQMVKVGDFWVDRYEMSLCGAGALGTGPGQNTTATGCSVTGVAPLANITWFQASAMCANSGKHLCSNAEWQAAAAGTPDPGSSDGTGGSCRTAAAGPRNTGGVSTAAGCRSAFGAEDMIGNLWERVSDWHQAGLTWQTADAQPTTAWPGPGYNSDGTWNVNGRVLDGASFVSGLPAATLRGGFYLDGTISGVFAFLLNEAPTSAGVNVGARCCAAVR